MTNTTDYRTMEAGRELDRLIAERLGWTKFNTMPTVLVEHDNHFDIETLMGWKNHYYLVVPRYSTDLNAAITLIPKDIYASFSYQPLFGGSWLAMIWEPRHVDHFDNANTPALAICRAWLAWKDSQP